MFGISFVGWHGCHGFRIRSGYPNKRTKGGLELLKLKFEGDVITILPTPFAQEVSQRGAKEKGVE